MILLEYLVSVSLRVNYSRFLQNGILSVRISKRSRLFPAIRFAINHKSRLAVLTVYISDQRYDTVKSEGARVSESNAPLSV